MPNSYPLLRHKTAGYAEVRQLLRTWPTWPERFFVMNKFRTSLRSLLTVTAVLVLFQGLSLVHAQQPAPKTPPPATATASPFGLDAPYQVEWVYRIKYGYKHEWWQIFKKYQIATLDKEKELGYVTDYKVFGPGLHTSEDSRWDFRIEITYKNITSFLQALPVESSLFGNDETYIKEENHRWELTINHWDLPIYQIDPHAGAE